MFGPDAQVNVGGSFRGIYIRSGEIHRRPRFLGAETRLSGFKQRLTIGFWFFERAPSTIVVNGAQLAVGANQSLSLIGGNVNLSDALLQAASGQVNIVSVGSAGQVALRLNGATSFLHLTGFKKLGGIDLNASTLDVSDGSVSGGSGGSVSVSGKNLLLDQGSIIKAQNRGTTSGGAIRVGLDGLLQLKNESSISATNDGAGKGTSVSVKANTVRMEGLISLGPHLLTGIESVVSARGSGPGGSVNVECQSLSVSNGARISTNTLGQGNGGTLAIKADGITLDGQDSDDFTGLAAQTLRTHQGGRGGTIRIDTNTLLVRSGAEISASSNGSGAGGGVGVKANSVTLDGQQSPYPTGIVAGTFANTGGGKGGTIRVDTKTLQVQSGAEINVDTQGNGRGGNISVNADNITLDRRESGNTTGLIAQTLADKGGKGGSITVNAKSLQIVGGAEISTDTLGTGAGGNISVKADDITLNGQGSPETTGITANTSSEAKSSKGGSIAIKSKNFQVLNGAIVTAFTAGGGNGGSITVNSDNITLDGQGRDHFTGLSTQTAADSAGGKGGRIIANTGTLNIVNGGEISSSSTGDGAGGSINVKSDSILLDGQGNPHFTGIAAGTFAFNRGGPG